MARFIHPLKAYSPIVVILLGRLTSVILLQLWKALSGISVTPGLIVTSVLSLFHVTFSLSQHQIPYTGGHVELNGGNVDDEEPLIVAVGATVDLDGGNVENGEKVVLKRGFDVDLTGGWVDDTSLHLSIVLPATYKS